MRRIVTEWFRIPRVWPILAAALAAFDRPVTVWSGACGSGEEAWAAAILLDEPATGVARGQAAVLYDGDVVMGAAAIDATSRAQRTVASQNTQ